MKYQYIYFFLCLSLKNVSEAEGILRKEYYGKFSGHIVGGVEVPIAMYPHVALFFVDSTKVMCGGSIVSDRVILTAGHCVNDYKNGRLFEPHRFEVYLGSSLAKSGAAYYVCKVVKHKKHSSTDKEDSQPFYFYDLAVLMLSERIKFGPTVQKVNIVPNESWRNKKSSFTVAGFGAVETQRLPSNKLLATRMHYVDWQTCNQSQSSEPITLPSHVFCMIGQKWTSDCNGDSGSGVIWRRYIVGLVSSGRDESCASDMLPSMYTNVYYFRKWIMLRIREADSLKKQDCPSRQTFKMNRNKKSTLI